jgi:putative FmdB family regulatory protein
MPFYEYQCSACGAQVEVLQKITDAPLKKCPECGRSRLAKLVSAPVFRLKGGGWYETDFKGDKENKRNLVAAEAAEAAAEAKPEEKSASAAEGKTEAKAKAETAPESSPPASAQPRPEASSTGSKRIGASRPVARPRPLVTKPKPAVARKAARRKAKR